MPKALVVPPSKFKLPFFRSQKFTPFLIGILILPVFFVETLFGQPGRNYVLLKSSYSAEEVLSKAVSITPSERQQAWQSLEFNAFVHFGLNTFTDREWGDGTDSPSLFNPSAFDARQWAKIIRNAGMKMLILTAKHHDGFCLWPTRFSDYSVKNSPLKKGGGDVVKEVSQACKEFGLKFGIYLSPWDRHERSYGDSPKYNEYYRNQLKELLSNYGEISEVWLDGACGEGPNGQRQDYDWHSYYKIIRQLQPNAVIAVMGPDVRWVGTESGYGRETEWSVVPIRLQDSISHDSGENVVDGAFSPMNLTDFDLGSREKISNAEALIWYPAEIDVSIRPGWFYHQEENDRVKTAGELVDIYFNSVGRNGVLLLNIPPDKRGTFHANDVKNLEGMKILLDSALRKNLLFGSTITFAGKKQEYDGTSPVQFEQKTTESVIETSAIMIIEFDLHAQREFNCAMLKEDLSFGQRVEGFHLEVMCDNGWHEFAKGTTIGNKRLLRFRTAQGERIRLVIDESRANAILSSLGLYLVPKEIAKKSE